jgi:hypothetical protein
MLLQLRQLQLGEAPVISVESDAMVLDALSLMSEYSRKEDFVIVSAN